MCKLIVVKIRYTSGKIRNSLYEPIVKKKGTATIQPG